METLSKTEMAQIVGGTQCPPFPKFTDEQLRGYLLDAQLKEELDQLNFEWDASF